jgi:hypothetical protein
MKDLKRCVWCGAVVRGRLRICETCRRESIRAFLSGKREKGVSAVRPLNPKPADRIGSTASGDILRNMRSRP